MAVIKGNLVKKFVDGGIEVAVSLNPEANAQADNQGKLQPQLLDNTYKMATSQHPEASYIGKAVVCQDGSHILFSIKTSKGLCGIMPKIKSMEEVITDGIYWTTPQRYGPIHAWVTRYSSEQKTIKVSDFEAYERGEAYRRSNVIISVLELVAYTQKGENYPQAGVEADVHPGSIARGAVASEFLPAITNAKLGNELGAMQMAFYVLKDADDVTNFAEALQGVTADDDWN